MKRYIRMVTLTGIVLLLFVLCATTTVHAESAMVTSEEGKEYIKVQEGYHQFPYYDYGQYTVGYGSTCPGDKYQEYKEKGVSVEEALVMLNESLAEVEKVINEKLIDKNGITLTQNQFDALVSYTYNLGPAWIYKRSGAIYNAVMNGQTGTDLIRTFSLYCHAGDEILPGLVKRRLTEANMYMNGVYSATVPENYGYVYYDPHGGIVNNDIQGFDIKASVKPAEVASAYGHTFMGWYTAKKGGTKVETLSSMVNKTVLHARWDTEEGVDLNPIDPIDIVVTGNCVNVRSGPGTNYSKKSLVNEGDKLTITCIESGSGYLWGESEKGWVCLTYTNYKDVIEGKVESTPEASPSPEASPLPEASETPTATPEPTPTPSQEPSASPEPTPEPTAKPTPTPTPAPTVEPTPTPTPTPKPTEPPAKEESAVKGTIQVIGALRVRNGAGTTNKVVGYVYNNNKVTITEQTTVNGEQWGNIGKGWICLTYVVLDENKETTPEATPSPQPTTPEAPSETPSTSTEQKGIITGNYLRIREGAGTEHKSMGLLFKGKTVIIHETKTDAAGQIWAKIDKGWISMEFVELTEGTPVDDDKKTVTVDYLRIRQEPNTTSKIMGYLFDGNRVAISETKTLDNGETWGKISNGWVSMEFVK